MSSITVNAPNLWRLETPGLPGWSRTARPGAARKYFMVSADEHVNEPHSAPAIERTMGGLTDIQRAKVLGENAARFFGFRVPVER